MYSKILVPLDGSSFSEQILPYARCFADAFRIPVELLRITDPDIRPPFWPPESSDVYLKKIGDKYFAAGTPAAVAEEIGVPAAVIVDRAKSDPACLIAMATHGMSGARRWLLGSVTSKVVQTAVNPLLLIRPSEGTDVSTPLRLHRIFVPLDGSGLAEKTLPHAVALAKELNLEIHLLRIYSLPADAYVVANGVIAQGPEPYREELAREAETYLAGKVAEIRGAGVERVVAIVAQGNAADEISDLARKTPNSLIAMSTHGRSGVGRWMLGSVAEKVIQLAPVPVLIIRAR
jgi:nucleotide-binding universal stress UspA family protein